MKYDVIIPVYKPNERMEAVLSCLEKQSVLPTRILLINTGKEYFEAYESEEIFLKKHPLVELFHVSEIEFDHGATRNLGVSKSQSPYFVLMTDDCIPESEKTMEELLYPFSKEYANPVGMTYARQLPNETCGIIERYTRDFNYDSEERLKTKNDIASLGIKAFFGSNVCAAYRRDIFDTLSGFPNRTIFNEDMIYARKLIEAGYGIYYAANAKVIHSHNYTGLQQYKRNFDLGVSHAMFPETFGDVKSESEGKKLVLQTVKYLCKKGKPHLVVKLVWQSGCKYLGYRKGKQFKKLSEKQILKRTMNKNFWKNRK